MVDMTDIYFDTVKYGNIMQIRILKSGYVNKDYYNTTWMPTPPIGNNIEEFGIIELGNVNFKHVMDSSVDSVKKYAEIFMVKLDEPMRKQGYGRVLYNRALDEAIALGLDGLASEDCLRNDVAERLYKNCRSIEYRGSTFTIYEKQKWETLKLFRP